MSGAAEVTAPSPGAIAKTLHDGIMQDLTVAGFRLRALEQAAPDALRPEIGALAQWLSERQAVLRDFVSELFDAEAGRPGDDLEVQVEVLLPGSQVVWEKHRGTTNPLSPSLVSTLLVLARAIAHHGPPKIVRITTSPELLTLAHDGSPLGGRSKPSAGVRRMIKDFGATLRITQHGDVEILSVAQSSRR